MKKIDLATYGVEEMNKVNGGGFFKVLKKTLYGIGIAFAVVAVVSTVGSAVPAA